MPQQITLPDGFGVKIVRGIPQLTISVPGILATFGVRKWLKERALHVPQSVLDRLSPEIEKRAAANAAAGGRATPNAQDYWRANESITADMLYDGVEAGLAQVTAGVKL